MTESLAGQNLKPTPLERAVRSHRLFVPLLAVLLPFVLSACSDYYLHTGLQPNPPPLGQDEDDPDDYDEPATLPGDPDDPGDPPDEIDPLEEEQPEEPEEPEELPDCEDTIMAEWQWWGSLPFGYEEHPYDGMGRAFYEPDYQMIDYSTVGMPDQGHTPPGYDRVYRATFDLWGEPPALFLSMQSDDGMWFFVNGVEVGQWGGGWQEEGCVNDDANCEESITIDPIDISDLLVEGSNVVAARVTNAIDNTYFDVYTECVD